MMQVNSSILYNLNELKQFALPSYQRIHLEKQMLAYKDFS